MMFDFVIVMAISFAIGAIAGSIYYNEPITSVFDGIRELWE